MNRDALPEPEELAALYLAGALPAEEHAEVEARLADDAALTAAVADLRQTADLLAAAGPSVPPPPGVRERLLANLSPRPTLPPGMTLARAADAEWMPMRPGVAYRFLNMDRQRHRFTALVRMEPGARYRGHSHDHPEECLVLEGELYVGDVLMRAGDYQYAEPGSRHPEQRTETGCLLLLSASLDEPPP